MKRNILRTFSLAFSLVLLFAVGCAPNERLAERVTLNYTEIELEVDQKQTLIAEVYPYDVDDTTVTWTSSNEQVATVSDGEVTGVSVGKATITASTKNGKSATCTVTVNHKILEGSMESFNQAVSAFKTAYEQDYLVGSSFSETTFNQISVDSYMEDISYTEKTLIYKANEGAIEVEHQVFDANTLKVNHSIDIKLIDGTYYIRVWVYKDQTIETNSVENKMLKVEKERTIESMQYDFGLSDSIYYYSVSGTKNFYINDIPQDSDSVKEYEKFEGKVQYDQMIFAIIKSIDNLDVKTLSYGAFDSLGESDHYFVQGQAQMAIKKESDVTSIVVVDGDTSVARSTETGDKEVEHGDYKLVESVITLSSDIQPMIIRLGEDFFMAEEPIAKHDILFFKRLA